MRRLRPITLLTTIGFLATAAPALATVPTGFADTTLVTGFSQPAAFAFLPDGRILVVEQVAKNLRLVAGGSLYGPALLNVPDVNTSGGERGLLGIAVDPGWPARAYVYVYFTRTPGNVIYIVRYTASGDLSDPESTSLSFAGRYDILTDIPDNAINHNGGTLRFGIDDMLYASIGEDADPCSAQDSTTFKGVILRLDVSALPDTGSGPPAKSLITPSDNPFPASPENLGLVFCYGLRNPFRFTIDPATGGVVIGDVGQNNYEEVDIAFGGENFGWPFREGPSVRTQSGCLEPGGTGNHAYDAPIAWYDRSGFTAAVIGGPRYRLAASPGGAYLFPSAYEGVVFFAEYYEGFVRAVQDTGGGWAPLGPVPGQPDADNWATGIANVSQWSQGPDGGLYYVKQFPGQLHRIQHQGSTGIADGARGFTPRAAPNPFRAGSGTLIRLGASGLGARTVEILDAQGRLVRRLSPAPAPAENEAVRWDGRDDAGNRAAPGVYFVTARGPEGRRSLRVTLVP